MPFHAVSQWGPFMIFGIGNDLCDCERIASIYEKHGLHFLKNVLTPKELDLMASFKFPAEFIAGRWAAKEAFAKALGTGIMTSQCTFLDIEILPDDKGKPFITLLNNAKAAAERLGISRIHVSISHERNMAAAVVLLETSENNPL